MLSQFGTSLETARHHYQHFVLEGLDKRLWEELKHQIFLGDEAFIERMQSKAHIDGDVLSVPQLQPTLISRLFDNFDLFRTFNCSFRQIYHF